MAILMSDTAQQLLGHHGYDAPSAGRTPRGAARGARRADDPMEGVLTRGRGSWKSLLRVGMQSKNECFSAKSAYEGA